MRRLLVLGGCVAVALCVAACRPTPNAGGAATQTANGDSKQPKEQGTGLPIRSGVDAFPGRWGLVILQQIPDEKQQPQLRELCMALFNFTEETPKAALQGEVLATFDKRFELKLEQLAAEGKHIELKLTGSAGPMDFQGDLADGLVRGSIVGAEGAPPQPAYLKPTSELTFAGWDAIVVPPGLDVMLEGMKQKDQPDGMLAAAKSLRGNPLSLEAYQAILQVLPKQTLPEDKVREIAADYVSSAEIWGPRMEQQALFGAATSVTMTRRYPKLALQLIDQAQKLEGKPANWDPMLKVFREQAEIDIGLAKLRLKDEAVQAEGYKEVKALLPTQRFNPELLGMLGEYELKTGDKAAAQSDFADIVALPLLEGLWLKSREGQPPGDPSPRERLLSLWEEQHGNNDGFDEYLGHVYQQRIGELLSQTRAEGPEPVADEDGKHTVLVELFTGAFCPPCVAGDLAETLVQQVYPKRVVALQYHQHIPGPDPLCNQDAEDRGGYYELGSTPSAFIDGLQIPSPPGVGGYIQHLQQSYSVMRSVVDQRLKATNDVAITATATAQNGELSVEASATGVAEDALKTARLRLALAENEIEMTAPNGVRRHEMVVREMLGGAKGIGSKGGKLSYSVQLPLAELKQHLADYLHQFEVGRDITFPEKPLVLKPLSLVVWVQNDQTREVLQTIIVPVTGELKYPGEEAAKGAADAAAPVNAGK